MRNALILLALALGIAFFGMGIEPLADTVSKRYASITAAVITNDSTSVDLDAFGEADGGGVSPGIFTDQGGIPGGAADEGTVNGVAGSASSVPSAIKEVLLVYGTSSSGADLGTTAETTQTSSSSDVLSTLIGGQAVALNSTASGEEGGASALGGPSGAGGGGGEGGGIGIRIRGRAVRDTLSRRGIEDIRIPGYVSDEGLLTGRLRSKEDIALIAASSALKDQNIEEITFVSGVISITYRARGRLFAIIPLSYAVRLSIDPRGASAEERVLVKFPWYKFFLQTYVSKHSLQSELDSVLGGIVEKKQQITVDTQARLFSAIAGALLERFDTVEGSVGTAR